MKYYAVRTGRCPGIYLTWDECEKNVKGFRNARFKSFKTKEEAQDFISIIAPVNVETAETPVKEKTVILNKKKRKK